MCKTVTFLSLGSVFSLDVVVAVVLVFPFFLPLSLGCVAWLVLSPLIPCAILQKLRPELAVELLFMCAATIHELHLKGAVHGKVHAANVFVTGTESPLTVSLAPPIKAVPDDIGERLS